MKLPELAAVLQKIADQGAEVFYAGAVGQQLADDVSQIIYFS